MRASLSKPPHFILSPRQPRSHNATKSLSKRAPASRKRGKNQSRSSLVHRHDSGLRACGAISVISTCHLQLRYTEHVYPFLHNWINLLLFSILMSFLQIIKCLQPDLPLLQAVQLLPAAATVSHHGSMIYKRSAYRILPIWSVFQ